MKMKKIIYCFYILNLEEKMQTCHDIADEFKTSAWYVSRLLCGKIPRKDSDYSILLELKKRELIDRVFYHGTYEVNNELPDGIDNESDKDIETNLYMESQINTVFQSRCHSLLCRVSRAISVLITRRQRQFIQERSA